MRRSTGSTWVARSQKPFALATSMTMRRIFAFCQLSIPALVWRLSQAIWHTCAGSCTKAGRRAGFPTGGPGEFAPWIVPAPFTAMPARSRIPLRSHRRCDDAPGGRRGPRRGALRGRSSRGSGCGAQRWPGSRRVRGGREVRRGAALIASWRTPFCPQRGVCRRVPARYTRTREHTRTTRKDHKQPRGRRKPIPARDEMGWTVFATPIVSPPVNDPRLKPVGLSLPRSRHRGAECLAG